MTPQEAVAIAAKTTDDPPAGVMALGDQGFVVGFHAKDPFTGLPVYVDAHTGEARTLSSDEYITIASRLTPA